MWFAFAVVQVVGGLLADILGEKLVLLLALSLVFVGSSALFAAPSYPLFFGALLVLGAGTGTLLVSSTTYIGKTTETIGSSHRVRR
jgi:MFS family permease